MPLLKEKDKYLMETGDDYIDGSTGNESRFINSSCKPNATFVAIGGYDIGTRVFLVATKNIKPHTMIYADKYGWKSKNKKFNLQCRCGMTVKCLNGEEFL